MNPVLEPQTMGLAHLLSQNSGIGLIPLVLLVLMSMGTLYYLLLKLWRREREKYRSRHYLQLFWQCNSLADIEHQPPRTNEPYSRLCQAALNAADQSQKAAGPLTLGSREAFLLRSLRHAMGQERLRLEAGLTFLASVGSAAPFVGLFGTVWGIYHALLTIANSGQSSLDKVAGPVGEALIMTGFGLAVALPAVLIYNLFVRLNRLKMAELEGFAHDLYALLTTGEYQPQRRY